MSLRKIVDHSRVNLFLYISLLTICSKVLSIQKMNISILSITVWNHCFIYFTCDISYLWINVYALGKPVLNLPLWQQGSPVKRWWTNPWAKSCPTCHKHIFTHRSEQICPSKMISSSCQTPEAKFIWSSRKCYSSEKITYVVSIHSCSVHYFPLQEKRRTKSSLTEWSRILLWKLYKTSLKKQHKSMINFVTQLAELRKTRRYIKKTSLKTKLNIIPRIKNKRCIMHFSNITILV